MQCNGVVPVASHTCHGDTGARTREKAWAERMEDLSVTGGSYLFGRPGRGRGRAGGRAERADAGSYGEGDSRSTTGGCFGRNGRSHGEIGGCC
jgi:hypothetical protein